MQSFLSDLGWHAEIQIRIDASAARSMATRQGIGRVRHLQVRHLWLQALVKAGVVRIEVVKGKFNPADILTKILSYLDATERLQLVGLSLSFGFGSLPSRGACRENFRHLPVRMPPVEAGFSLGSQVASSLGSVAMSAQARQPCTQSKQLPLQGSGASPVDFDSKAIPFRACHGCFGCGPPTSGEHDGDARPGDDR